MIIAAQNKKENRMIQGLQNAKRAAKSLYYCEERTAHCAPRMAAFSLVELSIVLVILGLLTGGILTGQNLIRAAELRAVTTEFSSYQTAVMTFKDKYMALPGDMPNATKFWGAMTNCGVASPSGTGTQTCNGDGDGQVEIGTSAGQTAEVYAFWKQLANAGMIEGSFTGIAGSASNWQHTASNTKVSRLSNGMWWTRTLLNHPGNSTDYAGNYGSFFYIGAATATSTPNVPILTPQEAWNIDSKTDDGKPATGKILAAFWNNLCAAADDGTHANNDYAASYKLSDTALQCVLIFIQAY